jgi:acyl-CoA reductase-like NAD-dependent aldehyde dehydrogenase
MNTITKHYIDGAFVESHGREVMDIINPTNSKVIARVTLADEEDTSAVAMLGGPNSYGILTWPRSRLRARLELARP